VPRTKSMKAPKSKLPISTKALPKLHRGASVERGKGMNADKLDEFIEQKSLDQFDASRGDHFLVVENNALEDDMGTVVRAFLDYDEALVYAKAQASGNVDHRVLRVTAQTLVVATMNDL
jgi:hypothetical protein